jgi:hypothetical protein
MYKIKFEVAESSSFNQVRDNWVRFLKLYIWAFPRDKQVRHNGVVVYSYKRIVLKSTYYSISIYNQWRAKVATILLLESQFFKHFCLKFRLVILLDLQITNAFMVVKLLSQLCFTCIYSATIQLHGFIQNSLNIFTEYLYTLQDI